MNNSPVRVFIGSGEASLLERKVFQYSLKKHSRRDLEIYVFNGTHNAVEPPNGEPFVAPMSLKAKYTSVTEFSNYRFLIPQLCNYEGRAIYVDSDMIALADIGELFDADMGGADMLAKGEAYGGSDEAAWGLSVTLFDCEKCRFDLDRYVRETEQGLYAQADRSELERLRPVRRTHQAHSLHGPPPAAVEVPRPSVRGHLVPVPGRGPQGRGGDGQGH
jgi:hypothetical protein